jgi:fructose-bisphosphate aldolase class II
VAVVNFGDLIQHALQHRYGLCAFPVESLQQLTQVLITAEDQHAPVVLAPVVRGGAGSLTGALAAACEVAAQEANVPVALLGCPVSDAEALTNRINAGCNGLLVSTAGGDFPEAVASTRELLATAKRCGLTLGGDFRGVSQANTDEAMAANTPVAEAIAYVERTGVDFLKVHVDTLVRAAGSRARPDFDRLKRVAEGTNVPLMIGSSGTLTPEQVHRLIDHRVAIVYQSSVQDANDSLRVAGELRLWGVAGRAAEVRERCRAWRLVEHVIEFNVKEDSLADVEDMLALGRQRLAAIPGVRRVVTGRAITENAKYRFCWIVTFANQQVVDYYRDHPVHVDFANTHFRPIAADRITIDFARC